jgi:hypothetical protein
MLGSDLFGTTLEIAGAGVSAAGRPRLPIRLMAALLYLKHAFNLSDEELVARWSENVVWQYFSGQDYYTPQLPLRWHPNWPLSHGHRRSRGGRTAQGNHRHGRAEQSHTTGGIRTGHC